MSRLNRLPVALAAAVLLAGAATQAFALTPKVASGSTSGLNWTAQSLLTGAAPGGTGTGSSTGPRPTRSGIDTPGTSPTSCHGRR